MNDKSLYERLIAPAGSPEFESAMTEIRGIVERLNATTDATENDNE